MQAHSTELARRAHALELQLLGGAAVDEQQAAAASVVSVDAQFAAMLAAKAQQNEQAAAQVAQRAPRAAAPPGRGLTGRQLSVQLQGRGVLPTGERTTDAADGTEGDTCEERAARARSGRTAGRVGGSSLTTILPRITLGLLPSPDCTRGVLVCTAVPQSPPACGSSHSATTPRRLRCALSATCHLPGTVHRAPVLRTAAGCWCREPCTVQLCVCHHPDVAQNRGGGAGPPQFHTKEDRAILAAITHCEPEEEVATTRRRSRSESAAPRRARPHAATATAREQQRGASAAPDAERLPSLQERAGDSAFAAPAKRSKAKGGAKRIPARPAVPEAGKQRPRAAPAPREQQKSTAAGTGSKPAALGMGGAPEQVGEQTRKLLEDHAKAMMLLSIPLLSQPQLDPPPCASSSAAPLTCMFEPCRSSVSSQLFDPNSGRCHTGRCRINHQSCIACLPSWCRKHSARRSSTWKCAGAAGGRALPRLPASLGTPQPSMINPVRDGANTGFDAGMLHPQAGPASHPTAAASRFSAEALSSVW